MSLKSPRSLTLCALLLTVMPAASLAGLGDLHPTEIPEGLIAPEDTVLISWLEPVTAILEIGPSAIEWTDSVTLLSSLPGELSFCPELATLSAGTWSARLHCPDTDDTSLSFYLFIEAASAVIMTLPQNGGLVSGSSTMLSWEPVLGVPYYHVLFSDQVIEISEDENGDPVIAGANLTWQVIVPETSVDYGAWDPSGFFNEMNGTPPPLVPGPTYNWLVLSNYGNNPALSSTRQAGVSAFTVVNDSPLDPPILLLPAIQDTLASETITFEWSNVADASYYHFYLSQIVDSDQNESSIPVYDQVSGQTLLDLPAASILMGSRYQWKVFALDDTGQGVASQSREFVYEIAMGTLVLRTRTEDGNPLPYADVDLQPLSGGGSPFPIVTGSAGGYDGDFAPGLYLLTASKAGYESAAQDGEIRENETSTIELVLSESPAFVAGSVRTPAQLPVSFALVTAVADQSGELRSVQAGASGDFQIGLPAGSWSFAASKNGYHTGNDIGATIAAGAYLELSDPLVLIPNSSTLSGAVLSDSGLPVVAATVEVSGESASLQQITGNEGLFQFSLDAGTWELSAAKLGFVSPAPRTIAVDQGEDLQLDPPITLSAEAAIVGGFVLADGGILTDATVTATPEAGEAQSVTSGPLGNYQLSLAPGTWTLIAGKAGYSPGPDVQLTLVAGSSHNGVELLLLPNPCSVSGVVTDGQSAIMGATISNGDLSIQSAWDGSYTLTLPTGSQSLEAWKLGYGGGAPLPLELVTGQDLIGIDWLLSPDAATVSGSVLCQGLPVSGAIIVLATASDTLLRSSNGQGEYSISLAPASFQLWADKEGMVSGQPLSLTIGPSQSLPGQDLLLQTATATLSGTVRAEGEPLRDATIYACSALGEASTSSNLDGAWVLVLPSDADWLLTASKYGYDSESIQTPTLVTGANWGHDFYLTALAAALGGRITDDDGLAVAGAILQLSGTQNATALSNGNGDYCLGLQPGNYELSISELGYDPHQQALELAQGSQSLDIMLHARFASLSGRVHNGAGAAVAGAALTASSALGGGSASSDADGYYSFPRLPAGEYEIRVEAPGFAVQTGSMSFVEDEDAQRDWQLAALSGSFAGRVEDGQGQALVGASLQVRDACLLIAQSQSDTDGGFLVEALPEDRPLSLTATLTGHSAASSNPLDDLWAPADDLHFVLAANTGLVQGLVLDAESAAPIAGAEIQVDDGEGFHGQALSDLSGAFRIEGLRNMSLYALSADAAGWAATEMADLAPDGSTIVVTLQPAPATVYGTLLATRNELVPPGSRLHGIPLDASGVEAVATIDSTGAFAISDLKPGEYSLLFRIDGHVTEPRSQAIVVMEGQNHGPYDFELIAAALASVSITGEDQIDAGASYLYRAAMSTANGELVNYPLAWSFSPESAGLLNAESGRFSPRSGYFGEVTLTARHESSGLQGSKTVGVYARLTTDSASLLDDGAGLAISVPRAAVSQSVRITVQRLTPSPIKRRADSFRVEGQLYHFLPDGLRFEAANPPKLTLPVPNSCYRRQLSVGWWDPECLRWEMLGGEKTGGGLRLALQHFSDYALLVANEPLNLRHAAVSPNPFSPYGPGGGAEIRFQVSSQELASPLVDIEIFNLLGDPVRTLVWQKAYAVGEEHAVPWNGLTEKNELARNGRYIVRITAHDNSGSKSSLLQAVLIK